MKTTVIHHSADFDGLFCREIARKFLPDAELIGWDFGDAPLEIPSEGTIYVMDLPVDRVFGKKFEGDRFSDREIESISDRIIWIDHHKSSIESHPASIPGYRIDGVAACRLAWQWFSIAEHNAQNQTNEMMQVPLPTKREFVERLVRDPLAVRLAGEYDIWDKRDPRAELFQHGLRSKPITDKMWQGMLYDDHTLLALDLCKSGEMIQYVREQEYAQVIKEQGFEASFEGLKFLCCCSHECDIRSHLFAGAIKPEHDALCGFTYTGKDWRVSLYHAPGNEHHDLSLIAKKFGGGGHRGACGFRVEKLPFRMSQDYETEMQFAAVMTATLQNTDNTVKDRIPRENPYWTVAYSDVCVAIDREMKHRKTAEKLRAALLGLAGVSTKEEVEGMAEALKMMPDDENRRAAQEVQKVLIETWPS
jgi:hypothetical protein